MLLQLDQLGFSFGTIIPNACNRSHNVLYGIYDSSSLELSIDVVDIISTIAFIIRSGGR